MAQRYSPSVAPAALAAVFRAPMGSRRLSTPDGPAGAEPAPELIGGGLAVDLHFSRLIVHGIAVGHVGGLLQTEPALHLVGGKILRMDELEIAIAEGLQKVGSASAVGEGVEGLQVDLRPGIEHAEEEAVIFSVGKITAGLAEILLNQGEAVVKLKIMPEKGLSQFYVIGPKPRQEPTPGRTAAGPAEWVLSVGL